MKNILYDRRKVSEVIKIFRGQGGFEKSQKLRSPGDKIFNLDRDNMYLVQLCGIHRTSQEIDNTHTVVIFNGFIFDMNQRRPNQLTRANLNTSILGGDDWIFHRVSSAFEFIFTARALKRVKKKVSHCNY